MELSLSIHWLTSLVLAELRQMPGRAEPLGDLALVGHLIRASPPEAAFDWCNQRRQADSLVSGVKRDVECFPWSFITMYSDAYF